MLREDYHLRHSPFEKEAEIIYILCANHAMQRKREVISHEDFIAELSQRLEKIAGTSKDGMIQK